MNAKIPSQMITIYRFSLIAKILLSLLLAGFLTLSIMGLYVGFTMDVTSAKIVGISFLLGVSYCYSDLFSFKLIIDKNTITKRSILINKQFNIADISYYLIDDHRNEYVIITSYGKKMRFTLFISNKKDFKKWLQDNNIKKN